MPDAGKNAIKTYSGDNAEVNFAITFPYSDQEHVSVKLLGVVQTRVTDWDFKSDDTTEITFVVAPPTAVGNVTIHRATTHPEPIIEFTDGAPITNDQLDSSAWQAIYYIEEVEDLT